ncbi:NepR family anti-sigma factor [Gluconobacter morbifer]|uniref:Anti-sigma factor NepR domain-containing protein n=1 Tax=Gluconobacter morbifer G707 TaxID=1088869 RepID=G6XI15_9PROT|nr:NepR family anti-sigma factor [Gluconobacter morbifer]EHH68455.1 hypothetical protein GMO_12250 [Gluconobacter morbifer G707]
MTGGDNYETSSGKQNSGEEQDSPFGIWLSRGLHQLFDDVANEPIPEELLRLIEEDRNK